MEYLGREVLPLDWFTKVASGPRRFGYLFRALSSLDDGNWKQEMKRVGIKGQNDKGTTHKNISIGKYLQQYTEGMWLSLGYAFQEANP